MADIGDTLPHCTGSGTEADPYKFQTEEGFLEAIDVDGAYVEAKNANMSFDCNNGVITSPINFKCLSFNGKGLTIANALINNSSSAIMTVVGGSVWQYSAGTMQIFSNLNIFNYAIINQNLPMSLMTGSWDSGDGYKVVKFSNCHFAGVCVGYPNASSSDSAGHSFIGYGRDNYYVNWIQYRFEGCTINNHLSDPTGSSSGKYFNFHPNYSGYHGKSYVLLKNSTLCISGDVPYKVHIRNTVMNNATIMSPKDKVTNKLKCSEYAEVVKQDSSDSGYNYHKMYVDTSGNLSLTDSSGLINSDRYTATGTKSLSGIVMQEHDDTASDYIYDATNLSNAGFIVGEVIE